MSGGGRAWTRIDGENATRRGIYAQTDAMTPAAIDEAACGCGCGFGGWVWGSPAPFPAPSPAVDEARAKQAIANQTRAWTRPPRNKGTASRRARNSADQISTAGRLAGEAFK